MTIGTSTGDTTVDPGPSVSGLKLAIAPRHISRFFPLLQCGVEVQDRVNVTVRSFLCARFQVDSDFLDLHVKTIFLDGKPVDDMDGAVVKDGSVLALSGAMPGLVGATMRRGGPLAGFRGGITHEAEQATEMGRDGTVKLKLFNLLITELGPRLLAQGVRVRADDLVNFLRSQPEDFWSNCKGVSLGNREVSPDHLVQLALADGSNTRIELTVVSDE